MDPTEMRSLDKVVQLTAAAEVKERKSHQGAGSDRSEVNRIIIHLLPRICDKLTTRKVTANKTILFLLNLLAENGHFSAGGGTQWNASVLTLMIVPLYTYASLLTRRSIQTVDDGDVTPQTANERSQASTESSRLAAKVTEHLLPDLNTPGMSTASFDIYELINDIDSMTRITRYASLAKSVDPDDPVRSHLAKYVIERAIQVTGEYLKNTRGSPNISVARRNALVSAHVPASLLSELRDTMSHASTLLFVTRRQMEADTPESVRLFRDLQWDLYKVSKQLSKTTHQLRLCQLEMFIKALSERQEWTKVDEASETLQHATRQLREQNWDAFDEKIVHLQSLPSLPPSVAALLSALSQTAASVKSLGRTSVDERRDQPWRIREVAAVAWPPTLYPPTTSAASEMSSCVGLQDMDDRLSVPTTVGAKHLVDGLPREDHAALHSDFQKRLYLAGTNRMRTATEQDSMGIRFVEELLTHERTRYEARAILMRMSGEASSAKRKALLDAMSLPADSKQQQQLRDALSRSAWPEVRRLLESESAAYADFVLMVETAKKRVIGRREIRQLSKAFGFGAHTSMRSCFESTFASYRKEVEERARAAVVDEILSDLILQVGSTKNSKLLVNDVAALRAAVKDSKGGDSYRQLVATLGSNEHDVIARSEFDRFCESLTTLEPAIRHQLSVAFGEHQTHAFRLYFDGEVAILRRILGMDVAALGEVNAGHRMTDDIRRRADVDPALVAALEMILLNLLTAIKDMVAPDLKTYRAVERLIRNAANTLDRECHFALGLALRNTLAHGDWLLESVHGQYLPRLMTATALVLAAEGDNIWTLVDLIRRPTEPPGQLLRSQFWSESGGTWRSDLGEVSRSGWNEDEVAGTLVTYEDAASRLWQIEVNL